MERGAWSVERGAWSVERGAWSVERGAWGVERGAWSVERGAWSVERGAWSVERGAWGVERGAWSVERGAWSVERGAWSVERGAWGREAWGVRRTVARGTVGTIRVSRVPRSGPPLPLLALICESGGVKRPEMGSKWRLWGNRLRGSLRRNSFLGKQLGLESRETRVKREKEVSPISILSCAENQARQTSAENPKT